MKDENQRHLLAKGQKHSVTISSLKKRTTVDLLFALSHCFLQIDCSRVEYCVFCPRRCKDEYLEQRRFEDGKAAEAAGS